MAVAVLDPDDASRYYGLRGEVVSISEDTAAAPIDDLSQRYVGRPYQGYGGSADAVRVLLTIRVDRVVHSPWA